MKNLIIKTGFIFFLVSVLGMATLQAQNVGGTGSNQSAPKEVKAAELSKGAYTSDVNLFTGTMATSYDLGTVSTFSGLSYKLQLSYSTTKTTGHNPGLVRGLSYGDGWNVNIPTISVTVEAYRNFYRAYEDNTAEHCKLLTSGDASREGNLVWFAPFISIPGVVSDRFVLKTIDTLRNEMVFVPNVMEKYVEARLRVNGSTWKVINNNGDVYDFKTAMTNYRAPSQLNYVEDSLRTGSGVSKNNVLPKEEPLTWYCDYIYNKNQPLDQQIMFDYEGFGSFNFYKEFDQPTLNQGLGMKVGNTLGLLSYVVPYRDILLKGIESYSARGSIERLELNYKTILPPTSASRDMLLLTEPCVRRHDSLYNYRIVYSDGVDNEDDSLQLHSNAYHDEFTTPLSFNYGLNDPHETFSTSWRRYLHVMHDDAYSLRYPLYSSTDNFKRPDNPYVFKKSSDSPTTPGEYYYQKNISSSTPNSEIAFDNGFLESPKITRDIIPGDLYEVKSYVKNYNITAEHLQICNFDINVVSGSGTEDGNGTNQVDEADFMIGTRGHNIFNTFNNPVKWTSAAHNIIGSTQPPNTVNGFIVTSNMFLMPGLPRSFSGINVQIGPANSDNDFSIDLQHDLSRYFVHTGPQTPNAYYTYKFPQKSANGGYSSECLRSPYTKPSGNFGIGLPWYMMKEVYSDLTNDADTNFNNEHYQFWWKDINKLYGGLGVSSYNNVPTSVDEDVRLAAFELVRYSKNPYMLYSVKKYKTNGYVHIQHPELNTEVLVSQLDLKYRFKLDSIYSYVYTNQSVYVLNDTTVGCSNYSSGNSYSIKKLLRKDFLGYQNIYLLDEIKQVPTNGSMANASSSYVYADLPATHFYYTKMNSDSLVGRGTSFNFAGNIYLINKIVDQLGGTMKYEYYPLNDVYHTHFAGLYVDNNSTLIPSSNPYHLPEPNTYKVQITVKSKQYFNSATAALPVKTWLYDYSEGSSFPGPCTDGAPVLLADRKIWGTGSNFIHNSQDIDFGFLTTIVKYPQLNSSTDVPYDKYTHYYQENRHLTFGKLKQVEKFDAAGQLLSKKNYDYKATMAFGNFMFTGNKAVSSVRNEIGPEYTSEYEEDYPYSFTSSYRRYFFGKCNIKMSEPLIPFLEMDDPSLFQGSTNKRHPNCYFVRLVKETNTDYDYTPMRNVSTTFVAEPAFRGVKLSDSGVDRENAQAFSGINSLKLEANLLTSSNPALAITNLVPLMRRNEMTNITEYEYWDADSIGITTCDGFEQLLNPDATARPEILLNYEPSFELFRTKTYSPHLAGAYNTTENYYYYDLKQDVNKLPRYGSGNSYDDPSNFDALYFSHLYGIRNLVYQKRVTSKAVNQPAIAKSEYYWYDAKTKTDTEFYNDTLYIDGLIESCPEPYEPDTIPSDSIPDNPGVYNDLGCYRAPIHDYTPPIGWGLTLIDGDWWFCPGAVQQDLTPAERDVAARPYIYPSDLATKLLLRRVDEQIDTVRPNLVFYEKHEPIMRFYELFEESSPGGPLVPQNDYNWYPGYKTKTKYRTLEHTPMGFVRLDMNERGLKTRYAYDTVFSVTVMDPVLNCFSGGAWDSRNQGVPRCITVGAFRSDSLTTCYVYNKDYTVDSIIDPNNMVLSYYYDNFSRLRMAMRNGDTLSVNAYSQWLNDTTLDFEDRADQNYVESWILLNKNSKMAEHSRAYVDPLGRKYDVQTQISDDYTNLTAYDSLMVHSGTTTYDNWDRVSRQYKPFKYVNGGSPVPFAPRFSSIAAKYTEQQYEGNQRGRVLRAAKFGESINVGHTVNSSYVIINGNQLRSELGNVAAIWQAISGETTTTPLQSQRYLKTAAIDEDAKKTITYTNALGQKVAVKTYSGLGTQEVTAFIYDSQGNLKKVINPNLQSTTYEYNLSGNLFRKVSVDADTVKYLYDVSGNVVLEQDANGKHGRNEEDSKPYMRRYTYDIFNRMVQQDRIHYSQYHDPLRYRPYVYGLSSGIADTTQAFYQYTNTATLDFFGGWIIEKCQVSLPIFRTVPPSQGGGTGLYPELDPGTNPIEPPVDLCPMVYANVYDSLMLSAHEKDWAYHFIVDVGDSHLGATTLTYLPGQNHLKGRLSMAKSYTHAGLFSNLNIYSYNNAGLMEREITQFNYAEDAFTSVIDYLQYNLRNSLLAQEVDANADGTIDMRYTYKYDGWNRLRYASAKQGSNTSQKLAEYNYDDALGLVSNTKYYNAYPGCGALIDSIAYTYDVRNRLTKLDSKLYTEKLYYDMDKPQTYHSVFKPAAIRNFNGNINGLIHTYKLNTAGNYAVTGGIMDSSTVYGYTYDGLNRLVKADASVLNVLDIGGVYSPRLKYGDETMSYDAIGNITTLNRGLYYNPSITTPAHAQHDWYYSYGANTNQLMDIDSINSLSLRKYRYDDNGNSVTQIIEKAKNSTDYMRSNLPLHTAITNDTTGMYNVVNAYYDYNNHDDRIYKGVYNDHGSQQYYYLRDASGKELAEYDIINNAWTHYAYGRERIAEYTASNIKYYNYDHLGSTRVIYSTGDDCEAPVAHTVETANDYYAFGKTLRSFNGNSKYGHQGSERENELSENDYYTHFRGLDDDIARWKQVDPVFHPSQSPYVSMGNNPVLMNDKLGDVEAPPDDYFDKVTGKYLGKDDAKTDNVRVIDENKFNEVNKGEGDKTEGLQKNSELINGKTNLSDRAAKNILAFYYAYAGFSPTDLAGGTIGVKPLMGNVADTKYGSEWNVPKGKFAIDVDKGAMGKVLQNKWDFVNLFKHERGVHGGQFLRNEQNGVNPIWSYQRDFNTWHQEVITTITDSYSWPKTSLNYKQHQYETLPHFSDKESMQKFYYQYGVK